MLRMLARISIVLPLFALISAPAKATPNCLRDNQACKLAGDTMVHDHRSGSRLYPGPSLVNNANLQRADRCKAANWFSLGQRFDILQSRISVEDKFTLVVVGAPRKVSTVRSPFPPTHLHRFGEQFRIAVAVLLLANAQSQRSLFPLRGSGRVAHLWLSIVSY